MNFQQLEYILAVKQYRNFGKAAAACFVTQPTLSAMIQKLEEELNVQIFDRSITPVAITEVGAEVLLQAQQIVQQVALLQDIAASASTKIYGEYHLAVIPTIAPALMPALATLGGLYPDLKLYVSELQTPILLEKLRAGEVNAAIAATPLFQKDMVEMPLYLEPLHVFVSSRETKMKKYVMPSDIQTERVWMLEEGNCLSSQFEHICNLKRSTPKHSNFKIKTGSMETLLQLVEANNGITILPELFCLGLDSTRKLGLRKFKQPKPVRQVSLLYKRGNAKERLNMLIATHVQQYVQGIISQNFKDGGIAVIPAYS
ncbi:MAG: hydrogen peroxide-inducible genes activator [Chitinophagales bacterium]|nr:hydrogen peroxide-inducible genes activator [Chitinophagales bacterium]